VQFCREPKLIVVVHDKGCWKGVFLAIFTLSPIWASNYSARPLAYHLSAYVRTANRRHFITMPLVGNMTCENTCTYVFMVTLLSFF